MTFNPGANGSVEALAVQEDGKILVGGAFTTLGGVARSNIGRLNPDGTLDTTFYPGANSYISTLAVQADGKIVVGGSFSELDGEPRSSIGRLSSKGVAFQDLNLNTSGTTLTWLRSGAGPEVWRVAFLFSTDGVNWTPLGAGTRITGGWQLAGLSLPHNQNLFIRARGYYATGFQNGSASIVASVRNAVVKDTSTAFIADAPDPSMVGQSFTVSYTVTSVYGAPTGSVTVSDGVDSCTGTVAAGSCSLTLTTPGLRTLTATYTGDPNFNGSASTEVALTVKVVVFLPLVLRE
jgi:hypothetical protein